MIYHPQYDDEICEPRLVESRPASLGGIRVRLDERLDLPALRGLRRLLADAGPMGRVELDFTAVEAMDPAALRLLQSDLESLRAAGTVVVVRRLRERVAGRLARHPLRDFMANEEDLFTDPDRDGPPFRPSER
ncbi:MAG: STAS domain-containing protein [Gemmatimonadota bacterium]